MTAVIVDDHEVSETALMAVSITEAAKIHHHPARGLLDFARRFGQRPALTGGLAFRSSVRDSWCAGFAGA
jgi:hypothetical protein